MSGNEVKIRIGLEKPGVDSGLKETNANLAQTGEVATKAGAAARPALDSIGVSAKQTAAALRGVPAQFTDIVTSLQGGQAPLTVLLQQGGQLKDMFGGTGAAARALGGYVLGLVNPYTLAAGSVGALALAYMRGTAEQESFTRSLIMSGNAAGTTAGQLMDQARNVAANTGATRGAAAETLNELAASGKVSASVLEKVTQAAVELERVGGAATAETVKEFVALGADPVSAILKLNDKYNFLTASVYEQIKALADQGRETEAATLAQNAYADTIEGRIPALKSNLGLLEKAWLGVGDGAKWAWDSMLSIGREDGLEEKLEKAKRFAENMARSGDSNTPEGKRSDAAAQQAIKEIEEQIAQQKKVTKEVSETNTQREAALKWMKDGDAYLDKEAKKRKEIAAIEREGLAAGATRIEIEKRIASVTEKYADRGKKSDPYLDSLIARSDEMTRVRKQLEDELKGFDQARKKDKSAEERAQADQIAGNYKKQFDTNLKRIAQQNELIGLSEREAQVKQALYKIEDDAQRVIEELTRQVKDETKLKEKLTEVEEGLADKKMKVAEATRKSYDEARTFESGWADAFTKYQDSATNAADTARGAFSGMTGAMEGAIKSFVRNGKIDFQSFGDAVINTLIDIQMQSMRTNVLAPLMQSGSNWLSSFLGGGSSSGPDTGAGSGFDSALWGVNSQHTGGIVGSAEGSGRRFVRSSVFSGAPKYHTGGIVGDEVPILAKRGEGVFTEGQMQAMGGGANVVVNVINNVSGARATQTQRNDGNGNRIIDVFLEQVDAAMADNISRGNGKTPAAMESRYGLSRAAGAY